MTVNTTTNRVSYAGNGTTTAFAVPFPFLADADLVVLERTDSTGVELTKTLTTHYTVSGAGDASGTVTMLTAPATGVTLVIYRDPALTQIVDLVPNDPLPVETAIEQPLDRLTMITQRTRELVERALRLPDGDTGFVAADMKIPAKVTRAGNYLSFDADGKPIASAGTGSDPAASSYMATVLDDTTAVAARRTLGAIGKVTTVAALKALTVADLADGDAIDVLGYYAAGDNGGGLFRWNASSTTTDDGGVVLTPDSAPASGRWIRQFDEKFVFEWFGAKVDDSTFDNAAVLNNVVTAMKREGIRNLYCGDVGSYYFNTRPAAFDVGVYIEGQSPRGSFLVRNYTETAAYVNPLDLATAAFLRWNGGSFATLGIDKPKGGGLRNIGVYAGAATTDGVAIGIYGTDTDNRPGYMSFENTVITSATGEFDFGVVIDGTNITASQGMRDIKFDGLWVFRCRDEHIRVKNGLGVVFAKTSIADGGLGVTPIVRVNGGGTSDTNSKYVHFSDCDNGGHFYLGDCEQVYFSSRIDGDLDVQTTATNCYIRAVVTGAVQIRSTTTRFNRTPVIECAVNRSVALSIPDNAWTAVAWDGEDYDTYSLHDNATNPSRITIPWEMKGTKLTFKAQVSFDTNATGIRGIRIVRNGVTVEAATVVAAYAGSSAQVQVQTKPLTCAANDYFTVEVYQNSTAALNIQATPASWFALEVAR